MHNNSIPADELCAAMHQQILEALPGAEVKVTGGGGHFEIEVVAAQFEGLNTLGKQRLVYSAIKELMAGNDAPVHAIDRMITATPS